MSFGTLSIIGLCIFFGLPLLSVFICLFFEYIYYPYFDKGTKSPDEFEYGDLYTEDSNPIYNGALGLGDTFWVFALDAIVLTLCTGGLDNPLIEGMEYPKLILLILAILWCGLSTIQYLINGFKNAADVGRTARNRKLLKKFKNDKQ